MSDPLIMLVDNGSSRPESTLKLRQIAARLGERIKRTIYPVSLQHANKLAPEALEGKAADTFAPFLRQRIKSGERDFILLPLFFGISRALTSFVPEQAKQLAEIHGEFRLRQADVLCPLPQGEPRLARILCENLPEGAERVILVDHGSPLPAVSAVRKRLAELMAEMLGEEVALEQAVMERRQGREYDFNGQLLQDLLPTLGQQDPNARLALSMLFMFPGRHAGSGGDIEEICRQAQQTYPQMQIQASALVSEHPLLIDILEDRLRQVFAVD